MNNVQPNKDRLSTDEAYMQMAEIWAKRSKSNRKQVGALVIKDRRVISDGYNGMPASTPLEDDVCEVLKDPTLPPTIDNMVTRPDVIHAEANALLKLEQSKEDVSGAAMYVTMAPCADCAERIIKSGIKSVFFRAIYRDTAGVEKLKEAGLKVQQL